MSVWLITLTIVEYDMSFLLPLIHQNTRHHCKITHNDSCTILVATCTCSYMQYTHMYLPIKGFALRSSTIRHVFTFNTSRRLTAPSVVIPQDWTSMAGSHKSNCTITTGITTHVLNLYCTRNCNIIQCS